MRTVALEEHFNLPDLNRRIDPAVLRQAGYPPADETPAIVHAPQAKLSEVGAERLADLDAAGITVQVLSLAGPGADLLPDKAGIAFARDANDALARIIAGHPDRFAGFAHLPMRIPEEAADELERSVHADDFCGAMVNGLTNGVFLDDPRFEVLLARAEALNVPIYLHPNLPPPAVRQSYYEGLPNPAVGNALSTVGWGWHSETAIHILRLVLSGALDRHPGLQLIIGHMGEMLPVMLERCDDAMGADTRSYLQRSISQTILDQVYVTTSGIFARPAFDALLATFGIDRVLFSVDYPFRPNAAGRTFLDGLSLSPADEAKLTHGNADRLLKLRC